MTVTIGVAIPTFIHHLQYLDRLLTSIASQTYLPSRVAISISSVKAHMSISIAQYPFPITIMTHTSDENAAFNRNCASRQLMDMDIVSFIDGDDEMHPQRLAVIVSVFQKLPTACLVLHGFTDAAFEPLDAEHLHVHQNRLRKCPWGATILQPPIANTNIHNAHVTVRSSVLREFQFSEAREHVSKEDTVFCTTVIDQYPTKCMYIEAELSRYTPTRSQQQHLHLHLQGGLGNQMFQLATAYAYGQLHRMPFSCTNSQYFDSFLIGFKQYASQADNCVRNMFIEPNWHFSQPLPAGLECIQGYFQSARYFERYRAELIFMFTPSYYIRQIVREQYVPLFTDSTVVLHVRRGDYLTVADGRVHNVITPQYYERALAHMHNLVGKDMKVLVFSDDLPWCKQQSILLNCGASFIDEPDDTIALYAMTKSTLFILSNSSFSWWAAWLSENVRCVVVPDTWFGPLGPQNWDTVYEPEWIQIPV